MIQAQAVRQRCAELWGTYKVMAQVMWKTWAGQRAADLTPQLVVRPRLRFCVAPTCSTGLLPRSAILKQLVAWHQLCTPMCRRPADCLALAVLPSSSLS